jgi:TDG/mug DNA glycosylase family protein
MPIFTKFGPLPDNHVPDLLAPNLKVVFCGTALGRISAERQAYYANPGNFFWRTLHDTGLTPERLRPEDYPQLLTYGIGLTDLCKAHFGNDNELPADAFDTAALREKILKYQPRMLAFTSKTGAASFLGKPTGALILGVQEEIIGSTHIHVLPSPSGQARIFWKREPWQAIADAVKAK